MPVHFDLGLTAIRRHAKQLRRQKRANRGFTLAGVDRSGGRLRLVWVRILVDFSSATYNFKDASMTNPALYGFAKVQTVDCDGKFFD